MLMNHWYADNSRSIGRTPLVKLNRITDGAEAARFVAEIKRLIEKPLLMLV
jgi:cysteine synthase A